MMANNHIKVAIICSTFALPYIPFDTTSNLYLQTFLYFVVIMDAAILSDIEHTNSKMGRKFYPIALLLSLFIKHRTFTHSLLFAFIIFVFAKLLPTYFSAAMYGVFIGIVSHILADGITNEGIYLLYPYNKRLRFLPYQLCIKTNGKMERYLVSPILSIASTFCILYLIYEYLLFIKVVVNI